MQPAVGETTPGVTKVATFITRAGPRGDELLLFCHPFAGVQIPAGTVDDGETPEEAALREAAEETGLAGFDLHAYLGHRDWHVPGDLRLIVARTTVYARPDTSSFDWATLPRSAVVRVERAEPGFTQVMYEEWDEEPDRHYITYRIEGWVRDEMLTTSLRRHFYHLTHPGDTPESWLVEIDYHTFTLFWAPLDDLPRPIGPQAAWLDVLRQVYPALQVTPAEGEEV
ncbi:MAG: NUDIX domain-containing protein [Anaerolineae bacterium]|nr:NUDIX domain-containing protein [Anaerolineae bacterium]